MNLYPKSKQELWADVRSIVVWLCVTLPLFTFLYLSGLLQSAGPVVWLQAQQRPAQPIESHPAPARWLG